MKPWKNIELITPNTFGFVYIIYNLTTNKIYIGCKQIFYTRKVKISKSEKKKTNTRKIYKTKLTESNWRDYTGSSLELNEDIKRGDIIERIILKTVQNKKQLHYYEQKYQFEYNVLETPSYNKNIAGRFYRKDLKLF